MPKITKIKEIPSKIKIISVKKNEPESLEEEVEKASGPDYTDIPEGGGFLPGLQVGGIHPLEDSPQEEPQEAPRANINRATNEEQEARELYDTGRRRQVLNRDKYNPSMEQTPTGSENVLPESAFGRRAPITEAGRQVNQAGMIRRRDDEESQLHQTEEEREYREGQPKMTKRRTEMF